jgi:hypothetical protein
MFLAVPEPAPRIANASANFGLDVWDVADERTIAITLLALRRARDQSDGTGSGASSLIFCRNV